MDIDDDAWREWIGRTTSSEAHLDPAQANRMAVTLDRPPTFTDGDLLPPAWHWLYFHDLVGASRLGADGHPALGVTLPPVPLGRRMWAAGALRFDRPVRLGQTATRTTVITDVSPKAGRSGALWFVTVEHHLEVGGRLGVREEQTIVYRDQDVPAPDPVRPRARTDADESAHWTLDATTLFRYSALTFNSHRIHYDVDYARDVEGYPGLVVHGPLLATLLMDLAEAGGHALASFAYRARAPLSPSDGLTTHVRRDGRGAALWAAAADGRLAMDATATYRDTHEEMTR